MRDIALILHVAAGVLAVLLGPLAIVLTLRRRGLNWAGETYHWAIALVCLTALVMVPYDWGRLWFFWPISLASYLFVYLGQIVHGLLLVDAGRSRPTQTVQILSPGGQVGVP